MKRVIRTVLTFISGVAAFYFVFWVGGALVFALLHLPPGITMLGSFLLAAVAGVVVVRYVWRHTASLRSGLATSVVLGAVAIGGIGFCAGFFGPILFAPDANQGPLLGIFITGPLGFVLGAIGGGVYWLARGHRVGRTPGHGAS